MSQREAVIILLDITSDLLIGSAGNLKAMM